VKVETLPPQGVEHLQTAAAAPPAKWVLSIGDAL
jgi:hypothetical protein